MNETLSVESTLESPSKPHQQKTSPQKKAIFLVHYMKVNQPFDNIKDKLDKNGYGENSLENKNTKISKRGRKPKKFSKMKKNQNNMLDFDLILNSLFPKKKEENSFPPMKKKFTMKKFPKKIIGHKRKRQIKSIINKSKKYIFY
jgi:hypothetical protein